MSPKIMRIRYTGMDLLIIGLIFFGLGMAAGFGLTIGNCQ